MFINYIIGTFWYNSEELSKRGSYGMIRSTRPVIRCVKRWHKLKIIATTRETYTLPECGYEIMNRKTVNGRSIKKKNRVPALGFAKIIMQENRLCARPAFIVNTDFITRAFALLKPKRFWTLFLFTQRSKFSENGLRAISHDFTFRVKIKNNNSGPYFYRFFFFLTVTNHVTCVITRAKSIS